MSEQELDGKTALVTGSGRNIGRAVALELAARGANVIVNSRTNRDELDEVAAEVRARGVGAIAVLGDVREPSTIEEMVRAGQEEFGGVDISVSNAATRPVQSLLEMSFEDWAGVIDTQLNVSFRLAKRVVPGMQEKQWGRIIHITGPDAFVGVPFRAHNVAAKGGLRGLTKALAIELGPYGITVNDVAPGATDTVKNDLSHPLRSNEQDAASRQRRVSVDDIPVGRLGRPEDVAYACGFLASPRADFFTGTVITCFGGQWNPC